MQPSTHPRILLTTDSVGGIWRYTIDLAHGLAARGITPIIAVLGPAPTPAQRDDAKPLDLVTTGLPLDWTATHPEALTNASHRLATLAALMGATSIHLHAPALIGTAQWPAPTIVVCHSDVGTWWATMRDGPPPPDLAWRIAATAAGLAQATAIIAPSQAHADAVRSVYGPHDIDVIHNGTTPPATRQSNRRPTILTAGRLWDEAKGMDWLDRAAAHLPIAAAGPTQGPTGGKAELHNLTLLGTLDAPAITRAYATHTVFASMAAYEPFGLAILEAATAGLHLVLRDTPVFRELWSGAATFVAREQDLLPALTQALQTTGDGGAKERAGRYTLDATTSATLALHRTVRKTSPLETGLPEGTSTGTTLTSEHTTPPAAPRKNTGPDSMRIAYFTHSLRSCWNHGNAHFLRGVLRELAARGHHVTAYEPTPSWSAENLVADASPAMLEAWRAAYPTLSTSLYDPAQDPAALAAEADLVIVHEWNEPALVAALGRARANGARHTLLFHDTHHRAASDPDAIRRYDLSAYDGVLAFGETLSEIYRSWGWAARVFTWHEAADTAHFRPPHQQNPRAGAVWIGNWGDGERTAELEAFLLAPTKAIPLPLTIHGVRYPADARTLLHQYGARYKGWLPNHEAPNVFARHLLTVHVPRRYYATTLPGIPTIRVFEALACGIPLVSAPWDDAEHLFSPGADFLVAPTGQAMRRHLADLVHDPALRADLVQHGLATIRARHTCAHRVDELLAILHTLEAKLVTA